MKHENSQMTDRIIWAAIVAWLWFAPQAKADCWGEAEAHYGVSRFLLLAMARHESGLNPAAINHNSDGSWDVGLMQINTGWLPVLKAYGVGLADLRDPCVNLQVGAWILANNFRQYGKNWRAVGAYNARTEWKRRHYARQVSVQFKRIAREYGIE